VPALNLSKSLAVRFIFPHAPVVAVTINNGMRMRAWYDIRQANLNERADVDGVRRSQAHVEALVTRETTRGVASRRVLLAGFSQAAIALYAGVRHAERLELIGLSTC
jgi:phospholipase/carboxylesterase